MASVCIGIPCYRDVAGETLDDYMRFAFHLGRRTEHDCFIAIKTKTEQFRARNAIVTAAQQMGCDYLFFLDDDHVLDWEGSRGPSEQYGIIEKLIAHMDADPQIGIVGAVYYHRGADCLPVLMADAQAGGYRFMRDNELEGGLQDVAVQGGGVMLLRLSMFDKLREPYFVPEVDLGTDLQICQQARDAGFRVCCDTSIHVGHVMSQRRIVHPNNRHQIAAECARQSSGNAEGMQQEWRTSSALALYRADAEEYLGMPIGQMPAIAERYDPAALREHEGDLLTYYAGLGNEQLARQVMFHHTDAMVQQMEHVHGLVNTEAPGYGLDYGCGSAPVGFELALRGHRVDFVDVDGAGAYEFTKWRAEKRDIKAGFALAGPYDYVLFLDSIEHIEDWRGALRSAIERMKPQSVLITNYFMNQDYENPEHISMDKRAVQDFLTEMRLAPMNKVLWIKHDIDLSDDREAA